MLRTEKRMRLCITLLILNLVFIWGNSLLPGEISGEISDWVKEILALIFPPGEDDGSGGFLIQLAHFTEFTMLGMWLCWLFAMLKKSKIPAFFLGAAAACVDETIQLFVPGRGPGIRDVCIDSAGVLTGILVLALMASVQNWRKRK